MPNEPEDLTRMSTHRPALLAAVATLGLAALAFAAGQVTAQQPAPEPAGPAAPEFETPRPPPAAEPASPPAESTAPARPAPRGTSERFEPTEKVRPDFDVAFPVDI